MFHWPRDGAPPIFDRRRKPEDDFADAAIATIDVPQTQPTGRHAPDAGTRRTICRLPSLLDAGEPVRVQGKFFFAGERKHFVKGVTYGPFAPGTHGAQFPERATVERDFALMRGAGVEHRARLHGAAGLAARSSPARPG